MYNISFPGKTFLIGEYAVLEGAPAVLINTKPRFYFTVTREGKRGNCFHADSPAGQWLKKHPRISESYYIESWDPYAGKGGFGLSGAQFNLVHLLGGVLEGKSINDMDLLKMWKDYRSLDFSGYKPSGADLISQMLGKVCLFTPEPFHANSMDWPFSDLDFFLIKTDMSLNTWEHLSRVKIDNSFSNLSDLTKEALNHIKNSDAKAFVSVLKRYADCLEQQNLVHEKTQEVLDQLKKIKQIVSAKGCGALGSEVIAVFFHPESKETVKKILIGSGSDFPGLSKYFSLDSGECIAADSGHLSQGMMIHSS